MAKDGEESSHAHLLLRSGAQKGAVLERGAWSGGAVGRACRKERDPVKWAAPPMA